MGEIPTSFIVMTYTTEELRMEHKRRFKRIDKWVATVVDKTGKILKTYQSKKGDGLWKHTMNG